MGSRGASASVVLCRIGDQHGLSGPATGREGSQTKRRGAHHRPPLALGRRARTVRARVPLQVVGQRSERSQRLAKLLQGLDELVAERRVLIQRPVDAGQGDLCVLKCRADGIRRLLQRREEWFDLCVDLRDDTMEVLHERRALGKRCRGRLEGPERRWRRAT